uniref:Uncharacterized protein n=1 Tax=Anguilla anguilla TaxID=7936 RepID=A0A0E9PYH3_ANGAN
MGNSLEIAQCADSI